MQTPMLLDAASGLWGAPLHDRRVLDLLAGDASAVELTFDGRVLGRLSLAGARAALRPALSACYAVPGGAAAVASPGVEPDLRGTDGARQAAEPLADLILSAAPARAGVFMKWAALVAATPGLKLTGGASDAGQAELNGAGVVFSRAMGGVTSIEINNLPLAGAPRTPQGGTRMNPRPYDVEAALKARGVTLSPILCTVHQGQRTYYLRATAPGKAPFWMRSVNWKPASPNQNYVLAASVVFEAPPSAQSLVEGMEEPPTLCR